MNKTINPTTAGVIIGVVVVLALGMIWFRSSQGPGAPSKDGRNEMGMPADVSKEFESRMKGTGGGATGLPKQGPPPGVPGGPPK